MLRSKILTLFYLENDNEKIDVNWELPRLRYKWNVLLHRVKNRI